jgi:hypothetical protein
LECGPFTPGEVRLAGGFFQSLERQGFEKRNLTMHTTAPPSATLADHIGQMEVLGTSLADFLNSQSFHYEVVLSVLLITYFEWAVAHPDTTMAASHLTTEMGKRLALHFNENPSGKVH